MKTEKRKPKRRVYNLCLGLKGAVSNAKIKAFEAALFSVFGLRKKKSLSGDKKEHDKKGFQRILF